MDLYYNEIAEGYDELHKDEQLSKYSLILSFLVNHYKVYSKLKALDVGCGTGLALDFFEFEDFTGIDPSERLLIQYQGERKIVQGHAEALPFQDKQFDVIISVTSLQNFDNVKTALNEMKRVCRDIIIVSFLKDCKDREFYEKIKKENFEIIEIIDEKKDIIFCLKCES